MPNLAYIDVKRVTLSQVCEQLQAQIAAKQAELDTSKATILSLLEGGGAREPTQPDPPAQSVTASCLGATASVRGPSNSCLLGSHAMSASSGPRLRGRTRSLHR